MGESALAGESVRSKGEGCMGEVAGEKLRRGSAASWNMKINLPFVALLHTWLPRLPGSQLGWEARTLEAPCGELEIDFSFRAPAGQVVLLTLNNLHLPLFASQPA